MQKFKPGVETMILLFSDRAASRVFTFPWYYRFAAVVEPLLRQVRNFDILVTFDAVNLWVQNSGDILQSVDDVVQHQTQSWFAVSFVLLRFSGVFPPCTILASLQHPAALCHALPLVWKYLHIIHP